MVAKQNVVLSQMNRSSVYPVVGPARQNGQNVLAKRNAAGRFGKQVETQVGKMFPDLKLDAVLKGRGLMSFR